MSKKYFVITLFCFCISLSIYVSYLILIKEINACDVFRKDNITDLLGIIISCISIVFAGYCVILAIDAYGKIKAIKEEAEEAKTTEDTTKEASEEEAKEESGKEAAGLYYRTFL